MKKILLCHMNMARIAEISAVCRGLGIDVEPISTTAYGQPLGKLAGMDLPEGMGMPGGVSMPSPTLDKIHIPGPGITSEMLVFAGMDQPEVFAFLQALREAGIGPVALKAMVTPFNACWSPETLFQELVKEHAAMTKKV